MLRLDRAFARQALTAQPTLIGWRPTGLELAHDLRELFDALSENATCDVRLVTLIESLAPRDIPRLLSVVARRVFELRVVADLADNVEGKGRRRRLAFFDRPAPLYALVSDLIEIGWHQIDDPEEWPRALAAASSATLEKDLAGLLQSVIEHARGAAKRQSQLWAEVVFDPFVGIQKRQIGQGAEANIEAAVLKRVATAALRQRDQIILLTHHAQTLRCWIDQIERRRVHDGIRASYNDLFGLGFEGLRDWVRRSRNDRSEGVLFLSERARRDAGAPLPLAPRLSVAVLRTSYTLRRSTRRAGRRLYADVSPAVIRHLLSAYYSGDAELAERLDRALSAFDRLVTPEIVAATAAEED